MRKPIQCGKKKALYSESLGIRFLTLESSSGDACEEPTAAKCPQRRKGVCNMNGSTSRKRIFEERSERAGRANQKAGKGGNAPREEQGLELPTKCHELRRGETLLKGDEGRG